MSTGNSTNINEITENSELGRESISIGFATDGAFEWLDHVVCAEPVREPVRDRCGRSTEPIEIDIDEVELVEPERVALADAPAPGPAPQAERLAATKEPAEPPAQERDSFEPVWVASSGDVRRSRPSAPPRPRRRATAWSAAATAVALLAAIFLGGRGDIEATRSARQPAVATDHGSLLAKQVSSDAIGFVFESDELDALADASPPPPANIATESSEAATSQTGLADAAALAAPTELERWARAHLEAGRTDQAVFWSRSLVRATPQDASAYLLLGAALIEAGRASEARTVFRRCVTEARRGDASECLAFAGR